MTDTTHTADADGPSAEEVEAYREMARAVLEAVRSDDALFPTDGSAS